MTDKEMLEFVRTVRRVAQSVGPMHGAWDVIGDAEAILAGQPSICSRQDIERELLRIAAAA